MSLTTLPSSPTEIESLLETLRLAADSATTPREMRDITSRIASVTRAYRIKTGHGLPPNPIVQAQEIDAKFRVQPHLSYLSEQVTEAVRDVERGKNRQLAISMPPRSGKSTLISQHTPLWILRRHPEWKIITASYDSALTTGWARQNRTLIEDRPELGIALSRDGGATAKWKTVEGGGIYATSVRGAMTGRGAKVMIIDDPIRDFVEAHSPVMRQNLWEWWLSVAQTRLEPPYLVIAVMTRWHEDDFIGRLFSKDYPGNPKSWQRCSLSAIAEPTDVLSRPEGAPLFSPVLPDETPEEATDRWSDVRTQVGSYTFSAMYQQRPAPAKGAIFDADWWRYWTLDPENVTEDERVVLLDPETLTGGRWLDSWDCAFKSTSPETGGYVVGQRWVRNGANRYLITQQRDRLSFTQTLGAMTTWAATDDPDNSYCGHLVHERLIEDKANGSAIIDVLKEKISGIKPINPTTSKQARARAVTPECESGNVYLPYPSDPGNEWMPDLLSELRNFPYDFHDDQVDALTQGLSGLRDVGKGRASVPGRLAGRRPQWQVPRDVGRAALTDLTRAGRR